MHRLVLNLSMQKQFYFLFFVNLQQKSNFDCLSLYFFNYLTMSRQALQLYKGDAATVILEIIGTIEGGPPVDVSSVRSM